jgi:hypothetical protein
LRGKRRRRRRMHICSVISKVVVCGANKKLFSL